jgi:DNA-binding SARP family transcriptional activator
VIVQRPGEGWRQVEFLILGPLGARVDGRGLPLGGAKQRALLALLLLHRNEVVSTDRLIDGLWGEAPPATAAKVVQVYVSRLRKLLGPSAAGGGRLVTRPPGYVLQLAPDELDLDRFEALVERAGRAMASGDAAAASAALGGALAMWRARRSRTWHSSPSPRRRQRAWRSSGWRPSRAASRPTSPSAGPPS